MPEGDTIHRTAFRLRSTIEQQRIRAAETRDRQIQAGTLVDHRIEAVEARGKHLLITLDDQRVLHSHMGMTGSWHLYQPGEAWRKPERRAAIWCTFDAAVAVCFTPKTLELLTHTAFRRHAYLQRLGPDLLNTHFDSEEALRRFRVHARMPIGEAVMNQTILSGIGNVYKSEVLFITRFCPFKPVAEFDDDQLHTILTTARDLMFRNLDGYPRTTRFALDRQRKWVYSRQGKPCLRCGTPISMRRQGDLGRSTYWCPSCQPA